MNHIFIRDFPLKFTRDFLIKKFYKGIPFNNDDDEKKSFSEFAETWLIDSTPKGNFLIFGVKRENFLMGLKIDFEIENLGFFGFFS